MPKRLITILGKTVQKASKIRGGGSALPGLVVEKFDPNYAKKILDNLTHGVVVISGTNGKTTTTKIVVELLESQGLKVFTNKSGSNFSRGVVASLLSEVTVGGKLNADIAVLELDEAHAVSFVKMIKPKYSLILNVLRDQLDRYGEIDKTAALLGEVVKNTQDSVVLNREDTLISGLSKNTNASVSYFGIDESLKFHFPSDNELYGEYHETTNIKASVILKSFVSKNAIYEIDGQNYSTELQLEGIYNVLNSAAAIALVKTIMGHKFQTINALDKLATIKPAFGRGENIKYKNTNVEIVLVKNPSGFRLALNSYDNNTHDTMIAINDAYADGRDMSWLWDVDFTILKDTLPSVTGTRAYDMALRLQYDDIYCELIEPNINKALSNFLSEFPSRPKRIYCTYTAMLQIRSKLTKGKGLKDIR
jgi:UDP-N-acetylmuramyl tripeptide synthase